jgi:hypothetical protein
MNYVMKDTSEDYVSPVIYIISEIKDIIPFHQLISVGNVIIFNIIYLFYY